MAWDLNSVLSDLMLKPLERMLATLREKAAQILAQVDDSSLLEDESDSSDSDISSEHAHFSKMTEIELLERVVDKVGKILAISIGEAVSSKTFDDMDDEEKGVLVELCQVLPARAARRGFAVGNKHYNFQSSVSVAASAQPREGKGVPMSKTEFSVGEMPSTLTVPEDVEDEDVPVICCYAPSTCSSQASWAPPMQKVNSWALDVLETSPEDLNAAVIYIFFDSSVGVLTGHAFTTKAEFQNFFDEVRRGYNDEPYHNFPHACDVLHTVYRLVSETKGVRWLSDLSLYAILVAGLCHDLGHQGKTNPYLIETRHELALRYNDNSPLENMHCARLFEICKNAKTDVFRKIDGDLYKQVRSVCIGSILHTDNAHHFEMVNDIKMFYELTSGTCESQAKDAELSDKYIADVLEKDAMLWLKLFLHLADVSNPCKPFKMCQKWAWRILDEFFAQGDEEKRLGLPVGMLNDRDKVGRPGSQHGFIMFLVCPLVTTAVKLFPPLHALTSELARNLEQWRDMWVAEASPPLDDIVKKDGDITRLQQQAESLRTRTITVKAVKGLKRTKSDAASPTRVAGSIFKTATGTSVMNQGLSVDGGGGDSDRNGLAMFVKVEPQPNLAMVVPECPPPQKCGESSRVDQLVSCHSEDRGSDGASDTSVVHIG
jgi:cAMP-specific phosphodiesterase 4